MRRLAIHVVALLVIFSAGLNAGIFVFDTDPFAGSDALTTPGRQIVGGEPFITFNVASDVFAFDPAIFGVSQILFAGVLAENLPASGVNTIALLTAPVPFNAGLAANAIAGQIASPGPGFFIYFNSGLDLPRLVYSTDLSDASADLKILARMTNLGGQAGRDALPTFTEANFTIVPEPSTFGLAAAGVLLTWGYVRRRGRD